MLGCYKPHYMGLGMGVGCKYASKHLITSQILGYEDSAEKWSSMVLGYDIIKGKNQLKVN